MPVSSFTAGLIFEQVRATRADLLSSAKNDFAFLAPKLSEDDETNKPIIAEWIETHPHALKSVEQLDTDKIDIEMERKMFGENATPQGRAAGYRKYGTEFAEQRRRAWNASPGIIQSGREPGEGADKADAATVAKAKQIVADAFEQSPFNPSRRFLTEGAR